MPLTRRRLRPALRRSLADSSIVLIGPLGAGKTTVSRLLASRVGLPLCSLDNVRWRYYAEHGYDRAMAVRLAQSEGVAGELRYTKPFEVYAVERALADHEPAIFDFGASNSVYDDERLLRRVERALAPVPHVVLLLPAPDPDESVAILQERLTRLLQARGETPGPELRPLNDVFVRHPSNRRLASRVIYTKGMAPGEVCDAILDSMS